MVRLKALSSRIVSEPHLGNLGKLDDETFCYFCVLCLSNSFLSYLIVGTMHRFQSIFLKFVSLQIYVSVGIQRFRSKSGVICMQRLNFAEKKRIWIIKNIKRNKKPWNFGSLIPFSTKPEDLQGIVITKNRLILNKTFYYL